MGPESSMALAASKSRAFALRMLSVCSTSFCASSLRKPFFASVESVANSSDAARARLAMSSMSVEI